MLRGHMNEVVLHAWAPRTRKALSSQAKAFKTFAELAGITHLPLSGEELCYYAIWLWIVRGLKSPKSIQMYLSGVRTLHKKLGLDCATPTSFGPLGQVVNGLKRKLQHKVKKAAPITPAILLGLLQTTSLTPLCLIEHQTLIVLRTLCLIFFQSMLRCSNMIPESRKQFDSRYILKWSNVEKVDYGLKITITHSKRSNTGKESTRSRWPHPRIPSSARSEPSSSSPTCMARSTSSRRRWSSSSRRPPESSFRSRRTSFSGGSAPC